MVVSATPLRSRYYDCKALNSCKGVAGMRERPYCFRVSSPCVNDRQVVRVTETHSWSAAIESIKTVPLPLRYRRLVGWLRA